MVNITLDKEVSLSLKLGVLKEGEGNIQKKIKQFPNTHYDSCVIRSLASLSLGIPTCQEIPME